MGGLNSKVKKRGLRWSNQHCFTHRPFVPQQNATSRWTQLPSSYPFRRGRVENLVDHRWKFTFQKIAGSSITKPKSIRCSSILNWRTCRSLSFGQIFGHYKKFLKCRTWKQNVYQVLSDSLDVVFKDKLPWGQVFFPVWFYGHDLLNKNNQTCLIKGSDLPISHSQIWTIALVWETKSCNA